MWLLLGAIAVWVFVYTFIRRVPRGYVAVSRNGDVLREGTFYLAKLKGLYNEPPDPVWLSTVPRTGTYTFSFLVPGNEVSCTAQITWQPSVMYADKFNITQHHQGIRQTNFVSESVAQKARQAEDETLVAVLRSSLTAKFERDKQWPEALPIFADIQASLHRDLEELLPDRSRLDLSSVGIAITRAIVTHTNLLKPVPKSPIQTPRMRILVRLEKHRERKRDAAELEVLKEQLIRDFPEESQFISQMVETERQRIVGPV